MPTPSLDAATGLLTRGYGYLPDLRRHQESRVLRTRLMGRPALVLLGPEAARFFYDESNVRRRGALPRPVKDTLFGHGGVHGLDGEEHRRRKAMFLSLMSAEGVADLVARTTEAWDDTAARWAEADRVVLFDETAAVLTRGVCDWVGVPVDRGDADPLSRDLVAMVDGFATPGPRHWRARRARGRCERWLAELVTQVRRGGAEARAGSALDVAAHHRNADGTLLDPHTAAVELINVLRPTVAVTYFVAFAAHALHRWPEHRERLRTGGPAYATAFAHEVRRFYPFAPAVAGEAVRDLSWEGAHVPAGALVVLDLYGHNHDPALWKDPYAFAPERFLDHTAGAFELIPQGGGDPHTGHRCPGEPVAVAMLEALAARLARLDYQVPEQDLRIPLERIPTRPRSGVVLTQVRPPATNRPVSARDRAGAPV